jgi:DNA-binding response OmpR family regulator
LQSKKILFFHNTADLAGLCRRILGKGYEIVTVELGEDGISSAGRHNPDMVLIDLEKDQQSGLELCRNLTSNAATFEIPVMVLFTRDDREAASRALLHGAVDYASKPLIPTLFAKRVQTTIERYSDKPPRCQNCHRPVRPEWSFCPFDGSPLKTDQSS